MIAAAATLNEHAFDPEPDYPNLYVLPLRFFDKYSDGNRLGEAPIVVGRYHNIRDVVEAALRLLEQSMRGPDAAPVDNPPPR